MLGEKRIKDLTDGILARSTADQTEVVILAGDSYLTRFANSTIHQNVAETDTEVRIRVVLGKRVGVATTNNLDDKALSQALENALAIARLQPENPDFKSLPGPKPIAEIAAFSEATEGQGGRCDLPDGPRGGGGRLRGADHRGVRGGGGQFAGCLCVPSHDLRRHQYRRDERYQRRLCFGPGPRRE
jgi:hypothetical protein